MEEDVTDLKEQLAQALYDHIPVGVGSQGLIPITKADLSDALEMGMDWSLREVTPPPLPPPPTHTHTHLPCLCRHPYGTVRPGLNRTWCA